MLTEPFFLTITAQVVAWSLDCYGWNQTRAEAREQSVTKV
jgi:hypothetical protein